MPIKLSEADRRGIVRHGKDWTCCLFLPNGHPSFSMPALDLYEKIHLAMFRCLKHKSSLCFSETLPELRQKGIPGDCFREPVARDLMTEDGSQNCRSSHEKDKGGGTGSGLDGLGDSSGLGRRKIFSAFVDEVSRLVGESPEYGIGRLNSPRGVVLSEKKIRFFGLASRSVR